MLLEEVPPALQEAPQLHHLVIQGAARTPDLRGLRFQNGADENLVDLLTAEGRRSYLSSLLVANNGPGILVQVYPILAVAKNGPIPTPRVGTLSSVVRSASGNASG